MFQKNKNGKWEVKYGGVNYYLDGVEWKIDLNIGKSLWLSHKKTYKRTFIIPVGKKSTKEAKVEIEKLLKEYNKPIIFEPDNTQQILTRMFRKEKIKQINAKIL